MAVHYDSTSRNVAPSVSQTSSHCLVCFTCTSKDSRSICELSGSNKSFTAFVYFSTPATLQIHARQRMHKNGWNSEHVKFSVNRHTRIIRVQQSASGRATGWHSRTCTRKCYAYAFTTLWGGSNRINTPFPTRFRQVSEPCHYHHCVDRVQLKGCRPWYCGC